MKIVSIFDSIQGEGIDTGLPCTFIRLAGCNLSCKFCDTDFKKREDMSIPEICSHIPDKSFVVITGGEPLIHDLSELVGALIRKECRIGLETNGMIELTSQMQISSISLSPKNSLVKLRHCTSLKLLYPYLPGCTPNDFKGFPASYKCIQPIDTGRAMTNRRIIRKAIAEVKKLGGEYRYSLQN